MRVSNKGLILAGLQLLLVASLGAKLLMDRATLPRAWAKATPYDPNLPIRGRYVSLRLEVQPSPGVEPANYPENRAALRVENNRLVAVPARPGQDGVLITARRPQSPGAPAGVVLQEPVDFFIPEHVPDPSRRPRGEELWVEVTVPRKGPPRPIRLGVKKDGALTPLSLD